MNNLRLGARQRADVEWALEPMSDYWCTESEAWARGGPVYPESVLPRLDGSLLVLEHCPPEVVGDLQYRLGEQLVSMAEHEGDSATVRRALALAARLG